MYGYHQKLLRVDLSSRKIEIQPLEEEVIRKYMGGLGLGLKFLYEETGPKTDPLSKENILAIFTGPCTATGIPMSGRHHLVSRSPQTGLFGGANVGGSWAVNCKRAGFDGMVIVGKADDPVYLWVHDGAAVLRDARSIWGKNSYEAADWLKEQTTSKAAAAVIGQAGERMAGIASIPHIGTVVRAAARTGLGAVMGSKNLKAIVVSGSGSVTVAKPAELKDYIKKLTPHIIKATEGFSKYGTSGGLENYEKLGNFPLQNWRLGRWSGAKKISGITMHDTILSGRKACMNCPVACGRHIKIESGPYGPMDCEGPEYETLGTYGGLCLVDDLAAISKANQLCNQYGLDTISAGSVIAFAMEAYEKGLITKTDTDGVELTWGNGQAIVEMTHKMGKGEGIGKIMAEGSKKMAEALGRNAIEFSVHVKGLEPSAHDPRRFWSQGISYATEARGACHNASWSHPYELALTMPEIGIAEPHKSYQVEGKAEMTAKLQDLMSAMDGMILCRFSQVGKAVTVQNHVDFLNLVTDWGIDISSYMKIGERLTNLKRMYNVQLGASRKDDMLPFRFQTLKRTGEELTNELPPMGRLLSDYYEYRKWSEDGIPTVEKLKNLGLDNLLTL
jgi:aldehyde:ferredoxin oxidoreductase